MTTRFFLFLAFTIQIHSFAGRGLSFLHPAFNRLDLRELETLQKTNSEEKELILFFKAESLFLQGRIQASEEILNSILKTCDGAVLKKDFEKKEALCFLSELGFSSEAEGLGFHFQKEKIQKVLGAIQSKKFTFEERAYLEGRILWRLPEAMGGSASKSLLGWESLRRLRPDLTSADFFMGQIYENQNKRNLAEEAFKRALSRNPPDPRAVLARAPESIPMKGRFYFGVIANPAGGAGITIGRRDDRLLDSDRKLDVAISAQSRAVYSGRLFYQDKESLAPVWLMGRLLAASEIDQFFGLGGRSKLNNLTEISQTRSQGALGFRRWFSQFYVEATVGFFLREPSSITGIESSNVEIRAQQQSFISGLELGIKKPYDFDLFLQLSGARRGILSTHSFELIRLGLQKDFSVGSSSQLRLRTLFRGINGQNPFGMLSQLSGNVSLPGVRVGRFREQMAWHATADWETPLWGEFSGEVFGNVASLGTSIDQLKRGPFLTGGGIALLIGTGAFRSRLEVGHFAGETVIQTGVQLFSE